MKKTICFLIITCILNSCRSKFNDSEILDYYDQIKYITINDGFINQIESKLIESKIKEITAEKLAFDKDNRNVNNISYQNNLMFEIKLSNQTKSTILKNEFEYIKNRKGRYVNVESIYLFNINLKGEQFRNYKFFIIQNFDYSTEVYLFDYLNKPKHKILYDNKDLINFTEELFQNFDYSFEEKSLFNSLGSLTVYKINATGSNLYSVDSKNIQEVQNYQIKILQQFYNF